MAPLLEELEVEVDRRARLFHVRGGLRERERQIAQRLGEQLGGAVVAAAAAAEEERDRVLAREPAQRDGDREAAPARVARGDDHVARARRRQVRRHVRGLARAVEDQQPAAVLGEPAARGLHGEALIGLGARAQAEREGELGEVRREQRRLLGAQPPDHVVLVGVAVGVLDRELRLADAPEAAHGLERGARQDGGQAGVEIGELFVAPRERGAAPVRHVPRRGERGVRRGVAQRLARAHPPDARGR